jgi:poly(A) polymerase
MNCKTVKSNLIANISPQASLIFSIFKDQVRMVGGAVRDMLINGKYDDEDFATILTPKKIIEILKLNKIYYLTIGIKYGTVCAIINNRKIEITTLRIDKFHQGRKCQVDFTDQYYHDAIRRDFTINSLYLDSQGIIYDYCNGIDDIKNKIVRFIGNPNQRINEDYLRILRFFRFGSQLNFNLDFEGIISAQKHHDKLELLSKERIINEISKMIEKSQPDALIKIIKVINHYKIYQSLIKNDFDISSYEFFYKIYPHKINLDLKLLILLTSNNNFQEFDDRNLKLIFTNKQKKYFKTILNLYSILFKNNLFDQKIFNINKNFISKIICCSIDFNNNIINDTLLFGIAKQKLLIDNLHDLLLKVCNVDFSLLPINSKDLIDYNFEKKQINILLKIAKKYWIENDYNLNKIEIINFLKNLKL